MCFNHVTNKITYLSLSFVSFASEMRRFYCRPKPNQKTLQCFSVTLGDHVQKEDCTIPAVKSSGCGFRFFAERQRCLPAVRAWAGAKPAGSRQAEMKSKYSP